MDGQPFGCRFHEWVKRPGQKPPAKSWETRSWTNGKARKIPGDTQEALGDQRQDVNEAVKNA